VQVRTSVVRPGHLHCVIPAGGVGPGPLDSRTRFVLCHERRAQKESLLRPRQWVLIPAQWLRPEPAEMAPFVAGPNTVLKMASGTSQLSVIARARRISPPAYLRQIAGLQPCCPLIPFWPDTELPRTTGQSRDRRDRLTTGIGYGGSHRTRYTLPDSLQRR